MEFAERFLYYKFGVTMGVSTNGDQVVAHYAAQYPSMFTVVANGSANQAPVPANVLSFSTSPGFDSASGGHTAVVQSSSVSSSGNGSVTVVEENAASSGVRVLTVTGWVVSYPGFPYIEWLRQMAGAPAITTTSLPQAEVTRAYTAQLTAAGGVTPYTWSLSSGSLPAGLSLAADGAISGAPEDTQSGTFPVTIQVTGANGLSSAAALQLTVAGYLQLFYADASTGSLRHAWWTGTAWDFETLDGPGSAMSGHTSDHVGTAVSATEINADPQLFYYDATSGSLRHAWWTGTAWQFETLDGPGSTMSGHTSDHVGTAVSATEINGYPQVYYHDATSGSLRHAFWTGTAWQFETLDGPGSTMSGHTSDHVGTAVNVTLQNGYPQAFYDDVTSHSLRHAWWTGTAWSFEILDGAGSTMSGHTSDHVGSAVNASLS